MRKRADAGPREKIVGWTVLLVLGMIGAGMIVSQRNLNPANTSLQPLARIDLAPKTPGLAPSPTLRIPSPDALVSLTPPERFDRDHLSEKIDGKAELYLSADFKSLLTQRFALKSSADDWFEVFLYDMGNPRNAFAVFSLQRRDDAEFSPDDPLAYRTANARFSARGPLYLEMIGSRPSETLMAAMASLAEAIARENGLVSALDSLPELSFFPAQDLDPQSLSLLPANAFGYEGLDQVFIARYLLAGREVTAFLSRRKDPGQAKDLARRYEEFLVRNGGLRLEHQGAVPEMQLVEILGTYVAIFTRGDFLAGVSEAADRDSALSVAASLHNQLGKAVR